jgi:hypothetical protein
MAVPGTPTVEAGSAGAACVSVGTVDEMNIITAVSIQIRNARDINIIGLFSPGLVVHL